MVMAQHLKLHLNLMMLIVGFTKHDNPALDLMMIAMISLILDDEGGGAVKVIFYFLSYTLIK